MRWRHNFDKKVSKNPLVRSLIKEIWQLGYSVKFVPSWRQLGFYNAMGMHHNELSERIIFCTRYKLNGSERSAGDVAFILAHELRHIQHVRQGLYSFYYDRDDLKPAQLCTLVAVGRRAELDCDRYACGRLKEAGMYSRLVHRTYPRYKVSGYLAYRFEVLYRKIQRPERRTSAETDKLMRKLNKVFNLIERNRLHEKKNS
jgi:hypothetical protein